MDKSQVKAINDAMSLLSILKDSTCLVLSSKAVNQHLEAMKAAGIPKEIVEHFWIVAEAMIKDFSID